MSDLLRLSKLMSERGLCSRREADELIADLRELVIGQRGDILAAQEVLPARWAIESAQ